MSSNAQDSVVYSPTALELVIPEKGALPARRVDRVDLAIKALAVTNAGQLMVMHVLGALLVDADTKGDKEFESDVRVRSGFTLCERNTAYAKQLFRAVDHQRVRELAESGVPWTWVRDALPLADRGKTVLDDFLASLQGVSLTRPQFDAALDEKMRTTRLPDNDGPPALPVDSPTASGTEKDKEDAADDSLVQWAKRVAKTMKTQEKQVDEKSGQWESVSGLLKDVPAEALPDYRKILGEARDSVEAQITKLEGLLACVNGGLTSLEGYQDVP